MRSDAWRRESTQLDEFSAKVWVGIKGQKRACVLNRNKHGNGASVPLNYRALALLRRSVDKLAQLVTGRLHAGRHEASTFSHIRSVQTWVVCIIFRKLFRKLFRKVYCKLQEGEGNRDPGPATQPARDPPVQTTSRRADSTWHRCPLSH